MYTCIISYSSYMSTMVLPLNFFFKAPSALNLKAYFNHYTKYKEYFIISSSSSVIIPKVFLFFFLLWTDRKREGGERDTHTHSGSASSIRSSFDSLAAHQTRCALTTATFAETPHSTDMSHNSWSKPVIVAHHLSPQKHTAGGIWIAQPVVCRSPRIGP